MNNTEAGRCYQVTISFNPFEPDTYRAALVHLANGNGRSGYWGYSAPGAAQPTLLPTATAWQGPIIGALARCLELSASDWPDRAAHGSYIDVSVYEACPGPNIEAGGIAPTPVPNGGTRPPRATQLVLREHLVGQRTRDGLSLSFADDQDYLELTVPIDLALEDLEPGPGALLAQAVCAIDGELARQQDAASRSSLRMRALSRSRRSTGNRRQDG